MLLLEINPGVWINVAQIVRLTHVDEGSVEHAGSARTEIRLTTGEVLFSKRDIDDLLEMTEAELSHHPR